MGNGLREGETCRQTKLLAVPQEQSLPSSSLRRGQAWTNTAFQSAVQCVVGRLGPGMCISAPSLLPPRGLLGVVSGPAVPAPLCVPVLSLAQAIVVYTDREVHGAVGSRVTLHCSFWSSEWVSDDISFTWRYQPEGGRDAISVSARGPWGGISL